MLLCIMSRIALTHAPLFCYMDVSARGILSTMVSSTSLVQKSLLMRRGSSSQRQWNTFFFFLLAPLMFLYKLLMHLIVQCPSSAQKAPLTCPLSSCYIYCNFTSLKIKQRLHAPFGKWEMKARCQCLLNKMCLRWQPWLWGYSCSAFQAGLNAWAN